MPASPSVPQVYDIDRSTAFVVAEINRKDLTATNDLQATKTTAAICLMNGHSKHVLQPSSSSDSPDVSRSDEQDRADMLRLCKGDDAALNNLMGRHGPRVFNYLLRSLQNEDDASDLAQETFVRVFKHCRRFDANKNFSVWLYTIASNLVRTKFRYRTRHPTVPLDADADTNHPTFRNADTLAESAPGPSESLQTLETVDAIRLAIADLPEELRTPLILFEYEELSHAEIGSILNCSPKAVESRLYRARRKLRSALSPFIENG